MGHHGRWETSVGKRQTDTSHREVSLFSELWKGKGKERKGKKRGETERESREELSPETRARLHK